MFNIEGKFFKSVELLSNFIILNLLFVVCCIPVITIGASKVALETVIYQITEGKEGYVVRGFFEVFIKHFKETTLIWIVYLFIMVIGIIDFYVSTLVKNPFFMGIVCFIASTILLLVNMTYTYVTSLFSRMNQPIMRKIRICFMISITHFPKTILLLLLELLPVFIVLLITIRTIFILLVYMTVGFAIITYIKQKILKNIECN